MRFALVHRTRYIYTQPVFLEPHFIRITPRQDASQRILSHELTITPEPAGRWQGLDSEGNPFTQVWFNGETPELVIEARTEAETLRENPFGFFLSADAATLPLRFSVAKAAGLAPCLNHEAPGESSSAMGPVVELAREMRAESKDRSLDFLLALNTWIFENVAKIVRREPGILAPEAVLMHRKGACRDAAVLFMASCRLAGIPARFVSGYQAGDEDSEEANDLHAWAEAWLPGAGWLGFDPTHGLMVADRHLALAASHDPALAALSQGSFRGTGATAAMHHELHLQLS